MARVNRTHKSRQLEDHIVAEGHGTEYAAEGAPVKDINWDVKSAEVHADPLKDEGMGEERIVRRFFFKLPPLPKGIDKPTDQEILEYHLKSTVVPMLWRDELEPIDQPRIIAGKKGAFTIVAICQARRSMIGGGAASRVFQKPELVQNIINGKS